MMVAAMTMMLLAGIQGAGDRDVFRIDTAVPVREVSPRIWGIFFEEINHSGDGGLYAEMIRNRSFEDNRVPEECTEDEKHFISPTGWKLPKGDQAIPHVGWSLVTERARAEFQLDTASPVNAASPTYARLTILATATDGGASLVNEGYWGMAVRENAWYDLSVYLRAESDFKGSVSAALVSEDRSRVFGATLLQAPAGVWTRQQVAIQSNGASDNARFELCVTGTGSVCFDLVSLLPRETFKNRPNGLRPDLASMVADLKPAFIRFPGGCIVEGFTPESAWDWKETVGDIALRPGRQNLWGYRASDGFGYHEMLQFAEDIGAEPIVVVNCGMTCQGRGPMLQPLEEMDAYVQSALDAIEYANGSTETKWGAMRAENGHPDPFRMKYITIGNENSGPDYAARYRIIAEAVRAQYPDIRIISNDRMPAAPVDLEEHHYYMTPGWFAANGAKYDAYDRTLPKVFVSEFAANQACGKGNLEAAVGEAAFMIGMENNSDIVDMAAYAPLFNHEHNREWPVNLIVFDHHRAYGTPSYHAQKLFAEHRPDTLLKVSYDAHSEVPPVHVQGCIGLGTWRTRAEFKDIEVSSGGTTVYAWKPEQGLEGWHTFLGDWKAEQGVISQSAITENCTLQAGDRQWADYTLRLKARKISGDEGFLILFRAQGPDTKHWVNLGGWGNQHHGVESFLQGARYGNYERKPGAIETGRWYDIEVTVEGNRVRVLLDGTMLFDHALERPQAAGIMANAGRIEKTGEYVVKVSNFLDTPWNTRVALEGCATPLQGTVYELHAPSRTEENSLDAPERVVPRTIPFQSEAGAFDHAFPPCSFTVMRLKPR